ncbi:MAG: hypothetical protein ACLSCR_06165 [Akkermansia sp.]
MMKNSAPALSASGFHPAERLPLFWLAAAYVLGLSWSLAYAFGFLFGEPLPWPAGRLMFAFTEFWFMDGPSRSCSPA